MKLLFILVEVGLLVAFGGTMAYDHWDAAAVLEWTVSFVFSLYVFSFAIDLMPAMRTRPDAAQHGRAPYSLRPMNTLEARDAEAGYGVGAGVNDAQLPEIEVRYTGHRSPLVPAPAADTDDTSPRATQDSQRALTANGHPPQYQKHLAPNPSTDPRDF